MADWQTYFIDACKLRLAVHDYDYDRKFVRSAGVQIRYVVDTNIAGFFLAPTEDKECERVELFELGRADEVKGEGVLGALAIAAAEQIFSGELQGQNGEPVYLAPAHHVELRNLIHGIRPAGQDPDQYDAYRKAIERESAEIERAYVEKKYVDFLQAIGRLSCELRKIGIAQVHNYKSLIRERRLSDLRSVAGEWQGAPGDIETVRALARTIAHEKRKDVGPDDAKEATYNVWRDAQTLAYIKELNEASGNSNIRYVFVTADDRLLRGIRGLHADGRREVQGCFARSVLAFLPLFPHGRKSGNIERLEPLDLVRRALDTLLEAFVREKGYYGQIVRWLREGVPDEVRK